MKVKRIHLITVWLFVGVLLVGMIALQGCETSELSGSGTSVEEKHEAMIMSEPETVFAQTAVQTTCPIMGTAIDKNAYAVYQGKKVYFCCAGCETPFFENPEKYLAKLPQFKNQ